MEQIDIAKRLLEGHFSEVSEALNKGKKGSAEFEAVCKKADVPPEMIKPIWEILLVIKDIRPMAWGPPIKGPPERGRPVVRDR